MTKDEACAEIRRLRKENERLQEEIEAQHDCWVIGFRSVMGMAKEYERARELLEKSWAYVLADDNTEFADEIRAFLD